jgi:signal peptidase I
LTESSDDSGAHAAPDSDDELDEELSGEELSELADASDAEPPPDDGKKSKGSKSQEPAASAPRNPLRYVFYLVWVFALPAGLAVGAVRASKPQAFAADAGLIRTFIGEQQVPATIMFFTVFAWIMWRFRYVLPFAKATGVLGRSDLPTGLGSKFDEAGQLVSEGRRILATRVEELRRDLTKREREAIVKSLDGLEAVMTAEKLDEKSFATKLTKAEQLVEKHLGRWRKGELREYAESIGVAVAVALILRFFVIEAFKIPSGSMIPTLMIGDHIFVAKYAYGPLLPSSDARLYERLPPARGDVMVFKFPENKEQDFIKRAVALPGDTLEALGGRPMLNGWLVPHCHVGRMDQPHGAKGHLYLEYLGEKMYLTMYDQKHSTMVCKADADCGMGKACRHGTCGMLQGPYQVAREEVWVMGDNRNNSHDSRSWKGGMGAGVPFENIKGRAMFVWWSWATKGGVALDRIFVNVMGAPKLPGGVDPKLHDGLERCVRERPGLAETTPPKGGTPVERPKPRSRRRRPSR